MELNLKIVDFSFFKFVTGFFFLAVSLISPIAAYVSILVLAVGKAHSLGAWMAIWRGGRFSWLYFFCVTIIIISVSWWGIKISSLLTLGFIAYALFAFHYLFDEFNLHEEKKNIRNIFSGIIPGLLLFVLLLKDFFQISISFGLLFGFTLVLLGVDFFFTRKVNWFFFQSKILVTYILLSNFLGNSAITILNIFLALHYFFWFIYPVYKLHKYKREERDGFIMMLLTIVIMSIFVYSSKIWGIAEVSDISLRTFYIASIAHILTTAPFGYLFGLPRPKVYANT